MIRLDTMLTRYVLVGLMLVALLAGMILGTGMQAQTLAAQGFRRYIEHYQMQDSRIVRPAWRNSVETGLDRNLSDYATDPLMILYARMIWAENRGYRGDRWLAAAIVSAWVARNRLADTAFYNCCSEYPPGLRCVLLKESQFQGLWQVDAREPLSTEDKALWPASVEIALRVWQGDIPDPVSGATRFHQRDGVLEWGEEAEDLVVWTRLAEPNRQILDALRQQGIRLPAIPR